MVARASTTTRSILVQLRDGSQLQIDNIPATAKITLGPVSPGKGDYENRDIALRIYTTVGNQLAVFRDVRSFRDMSLTVKAQKVVKSEALEAEVGPKGSKRKSEATVDYEWVDA